MFWKHSARTYRNAVNKPQICSGNIPLGLIDMLWEGSGNVPREGSNVTPSYLLGRFREDLSIYTFSYKKLPFFTSASCLGAQEFSA